LDFAFSPLSPMRKTLPTRYLSRGSRQFLPLQHHTSGKKEYAGEKEHKGEGMETKFS